MPNGPTLAATVMIVVAVSTPARAQSSTADDAAVRAVLTRFYDGWDAHDIDKMVSTYADDVDHINVNTMPCRPLSMCTTTMV
jgi:hypothetical protein